MTKARMYLNEINGALEGLRAREVTPNHARAVASLVRSGVAVVAEARALHEAAGTPLDDVLDFVVEPAPTAKRSAA